MIAWFGEKQEDLERQRDEWKALAHKVSDLLHTHEELNGRLRAICARQKALIEALLSENDALKDGGEDV